MDRPAIWGLLLGVLTSGVLQVTRERTWVMVMSRNMCQKNMTQLPPRGALFGQHTMSGRLDDFTPKVSIKRFKCRQLGEGEERRPIICRRSKPSHRLLGSCL